VIVEWTLIGPRLLWPARRSPLPAPSLPRRCGKPCLRSRRPAASQGRRGAHSPGALTAARAAGAGAQLAARQVRAGAAAEAAGPDRGGHRRRHQRRARAQGVRRRPGHGHHRCAPGARPAAPGAAARPASAPAAPAAPQERAARPETQAHAIIRVPGGGLCWVVARRAAGTP